MAKDRCEGGVKAHEINFEDEVDKLHGELDDGPVLQAGHVELAKEDCELVGRYMAGATKRKCPPAGSPPLEVFLLRLRPFGRRGTRGRGEVSAGSASAWRWAAQFAEPLRS